jgi:hypothetical protein
MLAVWGAGLGALYRAVAGGRGTFIILGLLVVSHWVLDVVTHRPDLPIYPGGAARVGLGLWNSVPATIAIEVPLFLAGLLAYLRATRARDAAGRWALGGLIAFLLLAYAANIAGGPPPSITALWVAATVGGILLITWGWWVDRHRMDNGER